MVLSSTDIINEVKVIVGDLAGQFNGTSAELKLSYELENTLLNLTADNIFYWNTREASSLSHSSGVITAPSGLAKILNLTDSGNNESYEFVTIEEFNLVRNNTDRAITYDRYQVIPYIVTVNTTTGAEQITVGTLATTPTTITYNMVYTQQTTSVDAWIPERMRPFLVSFTAANFLVKLDSPDISLVQLHTQIAGMCLQRENNIGINKGVSRFNTNLAANAMNAINTGGKLRF